VIRNKHIEDIKDHHFQKLITYFDQNFPYLSLCVCTSEFCLRVSKKNPVGFTKGKQSFILTASERP